MINGFWEIKRKSKNRVCYFELLFSSTAVPEMLQFTTELHCVGFSEFLGVQHLLILYDCTYPRNYASDKLIQTMLYTWQTTKIVIKIN